MEVIWGDSIGLTIVASDLATNRGLSETWINRGVNGYTMTNVLARVTGDLVTYTPRVCLLVCGHNDLKTGRTLTSFINDVTTFINNVQAANCECIISELLPSYALFGDVYRWNVKLRNLCISRNVKMTPALLYNEHKTRGKYNEKCLNSLYSADGIHPTTVDGIDNLELLASKSGLVENKMTFSQNTVDVNKMDFSTFILTGATLLDGELDISAGQTADSPVFVISDNADYVNITIASIPGISLFYRSASFPFFSDSNMPWLPFSGVLTANMFFQIRLSGV